MGYHPDSGCQDNAFTGRRDFYFMFNLIALCLSFLIFAPSTNVNIGPHLISRLPQSNYETSLSSSHPLSSEVFHTL